MKRKVLTIGYGGFEIEEFLETLLRSGVRHLVDVRELPISRKRGFSKSTLTTHLEAVGIGYSNLASLGSPGPSRARLRETGDYDRFFDEVRHHLEKPESKAEVDILVKIANKERSCLMCYCPDWEVCHRRCIVEMVSAQRGLCFEHLCRKHPKATRA